MGGSGLFFLKNGWVWVRVAGSGWEWLGVQFGKARITLHYYFQNFQLDLINFALDYLKNQLHFIIQTKVVLRIFRKSILVVTSLTVSDKVGFP